ncbi:MAG: amidohydrolase family protein [Bacteroidales bacterium]|nr:amidohydrolase family protein [Bacteroidales bacterium]
MKKSITVFILLIAFTGQIFTQTTGSPSLMQEAGYNYRINDAHCHYVDFVQETEGMDILLEQMDKAGVENIVLFGLPVTKLWTNYDQERPVYYDDNDAPVYYYAFTDVILAEAVKSLPKEQRDRIYPMICGFNPVDRNGIDHIKRMMEMYPDFWVGIGEIFFRHDDLSRMTYGRNPTANEVSMDPVYEFAAEKNLPVWIHSDLGDPTSTKPKFLYEMEEVIKDHPKTKIVWCHIGDTRNLDIDGLPEITRRLLSTYPNLYFDLSWIVFEQVIAPEGKPDPEWVAIFEQFPNRFMVGTDLIGEFSDYGKTIRKYEVLFAVLTPETAKKLSFENLFELLPKRSETRN